METRKPYQNQVLENPYLLGIDNNSAFYFYYEVFEVTTLSSETINIIKTEAESYVIYADNCLLDEQTLKNANIIFKKIPREIPKL